MKIIITFLITLFFANVVSGQIPAVLTIGSNIPMSDIKMKSVNGKQLTIKDELKKNGLLVMFSCNTCPYVLKYQARTLEIIKEAEKKNIGVVIVNSNEEYRTDADSYDAMKAYSKKQGYTVSYLLDSKSALADAFGATRTPECYLFDASGKLIYHGAIDDNATASLVGRKHLFSAMDESFAGKEISVKETRSMGCMIKRAD